MDYRTLIEGYKRVIASLYDPTLENYFRRCLTLFQHWKPAPHLRKSKSENEVFAALMGVRRCLSARQIPAFSKFIDQVTRDHPRMLPDAIYLAAMGHHFERIGRQQIAIHDFLSFLRGELETVREAIPGHVSDAEEPDSRREASFERAQGRYESIPDEFRYRATGWTMRWSPSDARWMRARASPHALQWPDSRRLRSPLRPEGGGTGVRWGLATPPRRRPWQRRPRAPAGSAGRDG